MSDRREDPPPGTSLGSWKGLVPICVAAAAAVFVGAGVDVVRSHQRAAKEERKAETAADSAETRPRFIVGVTESGNALVVRDVETGAGVGLPVAAPEDRRFHRVAAVKDGSYIVASYADRKVTFQRLRLGKEGRPKELQDIPDLSVPGVSTKWSDLAVTPDGDRIAYVTYKGARSRVDVVSTATGDRQVWTTKSTGRVGSLSWSGAKLSFVWSPVRSVDGKLKETKHEVRTLDTSGATGDLRLSKAVMDLPKGSTTAVRVDLGIVVGIVKDSQLSMKAYTSGGQQEVELWQRQVKGDLTDLDLAPGGKYYLATAGDLYPDADAQPVPGGDLADATW